VAHSGIKAVALAGSALLVLSGAALLARQTQPRRAAASAVSKPHTTWSEYGGGADSSQYSALTQINRSNVSQLQVAWTYATGDGAGYLFNPIVVDGTMYVKAKGGIAAIDAATGKELWTHPVPGNITNRGMNYWESKDRSERRLLFSSQQFLQALDAVTGEPVTSFGENGRVDLRIGLDRDPTKINAQSNTPGHVFEDLLILGSATNQAYNSAPGDIRAFNVRSGKLVWTFHTVPRPGEFGYETWPPEAWKTVGGANNWGEMAIDVARGIAYVPTGSPKFNFFGANRIGQDLFGDCLLALDARSGKRLWHFQMVHHDVWDYDNTTAPKLLTIRHDGKVVDVVAQPGKTGWLYVFNRVTGEPIWPIEERPVPQGAPFGEQVWPTQPFPTTPTPFARQSFTEQDISPYIDDPAEKARFLEDIRSARNEGMFTPIEGDRYTMQMPGNNGGSNFGSAAADPVRGIVYVVSKDWPSLLKLSLPANAQPQYDGSMPYTSGLGFMVTTQGMTAITPPWTSMTAIDVGTGTIKWHIPVGEVPELAAKGITDTGSQFPKVGPVVTAGGVIFTGTRDRKVRAFDVETGKVLWSFETPAGIEGMPAIYQVNGREYLVYCAAANPSTHTHAPFYSATPGQAVRGGAAGGRGEEGDDAAGAAGGRGGRSAVAEGAAQAPAGGRRGRGGRGGGTPIQGEYVAFALPTGAAR
jgi:quinate dehydrogenase (quinone)